MVRISMKSLPALMLAGLTTLSGCDRTTMLGRDDGARSETPSRDDARGDSSPPPARSAHPPAKDACVQARKCCVALGKLPDMEAAQPVCQMFWLRDVITPMVEEKDPSVKKDMQRVCELQMAQMLNLWAIYKMDHGGVKMPSACDFVHPKAGRMPFVE